MKCGVLAPSVTAALFLTSGLGATEIEPGEATAEQLLFMEVPIVVTASRREQPVAESPAAVTVITAEEIRQSGAITIPDVLRSVSGVDVMQFTARDYQVAVRGFNVALNNKVLVMIDGRTVYWEGFGMVFWDLFPVQIEEIERVEVVKSGVSSLYGANAFSGVINVITRKPSDLKGTEVKLGAGTSEAYLGSVIHAGGGERLYYKVSAGFDKTDEWDADESAGEVVRGNLAMEYGIGNGHDIALSAGRAHFKDRKAFASEQIGTISLAGNFDYLQLDYRYHDVSLRTFLKKEAFDSNTVRTGEEQKWRTSTYDADLTSSVDVATSNSLLLGASARHNSIDANRYIPEDHAQNLWALFFEDEQRLTKRLSVRVGERYDYHPLVKGHWSPRAALVYTPAANQTIRLSFTEAYRNPSFLNSYVHIEQEQSISLPPPLPPMRVPFSFVVEGNQYLKSEGVTSYELGYQSSWAGRIAFGANLFFNQYKDMQATSTTITSYGPNELFPGSPGGMVPKEAVAKNIKNGGARGVGGEIDVNAAVSDWLSLFANYSYERMTDEEDNPFTRTVDEKGRARAENPPNKANAGIRVRLGSGLSASVLVHWVDRTERLILDLDGNEHLAKVRGYTTVDGRIGYPFLKGRAEMSLEISNLLDNRHFEYPPGINLPDSSSDEIGRKILATLSARF